MTRPLALLSATRSLARLVVGLGLGALLGVAIVSCGEGVADPIVRVTQAPNGSAGGAVGNGDIGDLCAPCNSRPDCAAMEACLALTRGGARFCTRECTDGNARCPQGYLCGAVDGVPSLVCVPQTGNCSRSPS